MTDRPLIVCFGEILLRLNAPGKERLLQTNRFDVHVGGAEANVAVSLARFGRRARMVSIVADNALGEAALGELARHGVDISFVERIAGRMGLYFMSAGAVRRPSEILYDRASSAFALADPTFLNWPALLADAGWLHISGVTPAIGPNGAEAAIRAVRAAGQAGVKVSFDGNYRSQLWAAWKGDGPAILKQILAAADLAFINERDIALILARDFKDRADALKAAFDMFPRLQTIAATERNQTSVDDHQLTALLTTRLGEWRSRRHILTGVVDRIGGGDAFAAAMLDCLTSGKESQYAVDFAAAAAAFKHSISGDFNLASRDDIERAMSDAGLDVRR